MFEGISFRGQLLITTSRPVQAFFYDIPVFVAGFVWGSGAIRAALVAAFKFKHQIKKRTQGQQCVPS
eukprot:4355713-Amphidinium_carterae.1